MLALSISNLDPGQVALVISAVLGAIIPVLTSLAAHFEAAAKVKASIALVLGVIAGPVTAWLTGQGAPLVGYISGRSALFAFLVALASYAGVWKPIVELNARSFTLPNRGIGRPEV